mmetsp:Transcript_111390/g.237957  ORF Transcript_111390/g.237957 Transcript_111390/m.237957 type:complete len:246 (+) Transcript_111390:101-838(+)
MSFFAGKAAQTLLTSQVGQNMVMNQAQNMAKGQAQQLIGGVSGAYASMADRANVPPKKATFFGIPMEQGPGNPYSKSLNHWLFLTILAQGFVCGLRLVFIQDFVGSAWMALVVAVGFYAYKEDMNITYVVVWGLLSLLNGVFDTLGLVLPLALSVVTGLSILDTTIQVAVIVSYVLAALLAAHLYHVWSRSEEGFLPDIAPDFDPLGKFVESHDPGEFTPLIDDGSRTTTQSKRQEDFERGPGCC